MKNRWFTCGEFNRKTTPERCMKNCSHKNKEECIRKNIKEDEEIERVRALEEEKCPRCGCNLVSHLYFAFCPQCGFPDDEDEDEE